MRFWFLSVLAACGTAAEAPPPAGVPSSPAAGVPGEGRTTAQLLASPPPELAGYGKVLSKLATRHGVGLVRCPLAGGGRARVVYGTERDQLWTNGPLWRMEIDPATDPPWDPVFDEVVSEADWLTLMVTPGATQAYIGLGSKVLQVDFAPAAAGQVSICSGAHDLPLRTVKGKVEGMRADASAFVVPCLSDEKEVGKDGTFVTQVPAPCRLWVESPPGRSQKVDIGPGDDKLEVSFTMTTDPLQNEDRTWSPDGLKKAVATVDEADVRWAATNALLEELSTELASDPGAMRALHRYKYNQSIWGRVIQRTGASVDASQGKTPRKVDRLESPQRPK